MSPQRKEAIGKVAIAMLPAIGGALLWAAHAFASQAVAPVESRVTVVETKQDADAVLLKEVRDDVKEILRRMPRE